jgi:hypothetical protein
MTKQEPIELHFETVAMANYAITKRLLTFLLSKQLLDDTEIQGILEASMQDILRTTLPIGPQQAEQALAFFWSGFTTNKPDSDVQ